MSVLSCKWIKSNFIGKRLLPLRVINDERGTFFLWFLFTIIAGLIGPIINLVNRWALGNETFHSSLEKDIDNGTFYTFSIVLIASSIGLLFIKLVNEKIPFKNLKLYFIAVCIFPMFFAGIFYSGDSLAHKNDTEFNAAKHNSKIRCSSVRLSSPVIKRSINRESQNMYSRRHYYQLIFVIIAICIAIYSFCLEYMSLHADKFDVLRDDYSENARERIEGLKQSSNQNPQKTQLDDILYEQS